MSNSLWSIWVELPILLRLFWFVLFLVSIYMLLSVSLIMLRLRSLATHPPSEGIFSLRGSAALLQARCANLHYLLGATFYFFGSIFFLVLPLAARVEDNGRTPFGVLILENLLRYFGFAAKVFFVFLILHCLQWVVSARVQSYALRSDARNLSDE
jgi:hypothetical protein